MDLGTLVDRCRQGDPLAWEALVRRYQSQVYGLAFHYLRNAEEARDISQEIFIRLYERLHTFHGETFNSWLMRIARNLCIDRIRRIKARPPASDVAVEDGPQLPDSGPGPEDAWLSESRKRLVYKALGKMSDKHREVILLKEIQGLDLKEIAELLQAPVGTIKSRCNRARIELARQVLALDPAYGS